MRSGLAERLLDRARAIRFGIVGIAATAAYLAIVNLLAVPVGRLTPFAAHLVGLSVSIGVSYLGHHLYTFRLSGRHGFYFGRFAIITATLFVLAGALAFIGDRYLGLPALAISAAITILYPAGSYILHTLWTFAADHGAPAPSG